MPNLRGVMDRRRKELANPGIWANLQREALRMRRQPTRAEDRLWQMLRGGKLAGLRFRRQHPLGRFIADFYCVQAGLVIEVDGPPHDEADAAAADSGRDAFLQSMGLRTIRFSNNDVMTNLPAVLSRIRQEISRSE